MPAAVAVQSPVEHRFVLRYACLLVPAVNVFGD
jgi:hypothetical protein